MFGGGTGGRSSALSTRSEGSATNATVVSGNEITDTVAGKRGSCASDTFSGDSELQSHLAILSSAFGGITAIRGGFDFDEQQPISVEPVTF